MSGVYSPFILLSPKPIYLAVCLMDLSGLHPIEGCICHVSVTHPLVRCVFVQVECPSSVIEKYPYITI